MKDRPRGPGRGEIEVAEDAARLLPEDGAAEPSDSAAEHRVSVDSAEGDADAERLLLGRARAAGASTALLLPGERPEPRGNAPEKSLSAPRDGTRGGVAREGAKSPAGSSSSAPPKAPSQPEGDLGTNGGPHMRKGPVPPQLPMSRHAQQQHLRNQQFLQQLAAEGADDEDDLEAGADDQPACRICLEPDGRDFIAPCKCKGSNQFVHRECLDRWRSVKEGFAFAHCTTCKMRYHLRVHVPADAKWRTAKFRFFVARDALAVTLLVQSLICGFGYFVYLVDWGLAGSSLKRASGFHSSTTFYYLCGLAVFFFVSGILGCVLTCIDRRFRSDIGGPCRELCACCCNPLMWGDGHCCTPLCIYADWTACADCTGICTECLAGGGMGEAGAMCMVTLGMVALAVFVVVGFFYSLVVAAVVAQRIWQRHYHILAKRMLTKEYVVEDLAGQALDNNWTAPPLPPEHEKQLRDMKLL